MAVLMREAIGSSLRRARTARRRTLRDVSRRARVSLGYLSEVERGQKEASSELLASICDALEVELADLLAEVSLELRLAATGSGDLRPVTASPGSDGEVEPVAEQDAGTQPAAEPALALVGAGQPGVARSALRRGGAVSLAA